MEDSLKELRAAENILQNGVRMKMRAPFLFRLFGVKTIGLVVRSPLEGTLHKVASYYLRSGITQAQLQDISHEQALGLMTVHGKNITKAVAAAWLNGYWSIKLFTNLLAAYMRWHCTTKEILTILNMVLVLGGTSDFMSITRSVRLMKLTTPRMGRETQGS